MLKIGNLKVEEPIERKLLSMDSFSDYYKFGLDNQLRDKINTILYEFAQKNNLSLPYVCDNFEVKSSSPTIENYSEEGIRKCTFTYQLELQPKKGTVMNPYPPED